MHVLIVGGSDAGISAALRIRELDRSVEVTVVLRDAYPNYSVCGLPFFLSGETPDVASLAHRTDFEGMRLLCNTRVAALDPSARVATLVGQDVPATMSYDRVVVCTGARPASPHLPGSHLPGVHVLRSMEHGLSMAAGLAEASVRSAVIVGGGYIGLEMCDALRRRGLDVTLVNHAPTVLATVEPELGRVVGEELIQQGVRVYNGQAIDQIERAGPRLAVSGKGGFRAVADLVLLALGVSPETELALAAGAETGHKGALRVTRRMETTVPAMWAAGDCVETWHRLLDRPDYLPLGTTAHKQGRIAGENAIGGTREFAGVVGSQVVKLFDIAVARTGLLEREARAAGYDAVTTQAEAWDHKAYYPGAAKLFTRITGDRQTGRLLGAQLLGGAGSEVAKRVDVFATALFHGACISELEELDLSYTPPFSSPWDAAQVAAQAWTAEWSRGRMPSRNRVVYGT